MGAGGGGGQKGAVRFFFLPLQKMVYAALFCSVLEILQHMFVFSLKW